MTANVANVPLLSSPPSLPFSTAAAHIISVQMLKQSSRVGVFNGISPVIHSLCTAAPSNLLISHLVNSHEENHWDPVVISEKAPQGRFIIIIVNIKSIQCSHSRYGGTALDKLLKQFRKINLINSLSVA